MREQDADGMILNGKLRNMIVRMRIQKKVSSRFQNFAKAPNKKEGKSIFGLNAMMSDLRKVIRPTNLLA